MKEYMIVDGYNIIGSWKEFSALRKEDIDGARKQLTAFMMEYASLTGHRTIVVFDAHLGTQLERREEMEGDVLVIFTKKNETADHYIERLVFNLAKDYIVRVATSDRIEQQLVLGSGGVRVSARELREIFFNLKETTKATFQTPKIEKKGGFLEERIDENVAKILDQWRKK